MIGRLALLFVAAAGLAAVAGWELAPPISEPVVPPLARPAPPSAVPQPASDMDGARRLLAERDPWGLRAPPPPPPVPPPPPPPPPPPWRLAGVVRTGGQLVAVLIVGAPPGTTEYRRRGESLPDGSRIVEIAGGGVTVDRDGVRQRLTPSGATVTR